jgi:multiple sugar transport system permease protein
MPNILLFSLFTVFPLLFTFVLAFATWDGVHPLNLVGFENFVNLFAGDRSERFLKALANTFLYTAGTVPFIVLFSLLIALLMNTNIRGRGFFRTFFFIPNITSMVAIGLVWGAIFAPQAGPVNSFLRAIGIENPPGWHTASNSALMTIMIVRVWQAVGFFSIIYLAGLQGIPAELYEAAIIDGTNNWKRFIYITLPMLAPTTFFVVIISILASFKVWDLVYVMTSGGPGYSTNVLVYVITLFGFGYTQYGLAGAASVILFIIIASLTIFQYRVQNRYLKEVYSNE